MKLIQRFGYYLGGLSIGIVILVFIWKGKKTEFNYFPEARILKDINTKKLIYSQNIIEAINNRSIDSVAIADILKTGDVDVWNKIKMDSCIQYDIQGKKDLKNVTLKIINCDSITTIDSVLIE